MKMTEMTKEQHMEARISKAMNSIQRVVEDQRALELIKSNLELIYESGHLKGDSDSFKRWVMKEDVKMEGDC